MAHMKSGQLSRAPSAVAFNKHFRKWKQAFWKMERFAVRQSIDQQLQEAREP